MVFHWTLSGNKSPQNFRTLLLYSSRSQQCYSLDGLYSYSYRQVLQSQYQTFGDSTERTNYYWYHRYFHIPLFFSVLLRSVGTYLSFRFPYVLPSDQLERRNPQSIRFSFLFFVFFFVCLFVCFFVYYH